jgi:hypothetical protein
MINLTFVLAGNLPNAPAPAHYREAARRFAETYKAYPPDYEHRLCLIDSNGGYSPEVAEIFAGIPHEVIVYRGSGWDIGAHVYAAYTLPADDWVMCFSSWAHFRQRGWLKAFAEARERHGDGLYGSMASFEHRPHIRGTGFLIRCGRIQRYPYGCNSRTESLKFEVGPNSITNWCLRQGYGAWVVAPDGVYAMEDARSIRNGFRQGDQSNIWTFDKHTAIFEAADAAERAKLTSFAYDFENSIAANTGVLLFRPEVGDQMDPELKDQLEKLIQSDAALKIIQNSVFWRATAPLRAVRRLVLGRSRS